MNTSSKAKKLCWNCEGEVNMQATQCPFCGSSLGAIQDGKSAEPPYALHALNTSANEYADNPFGPPSGSSSMNSQGSYGGEESSQGTSQTAAHASITGLPSGQFHGQSHGQPQGYGVTQTEWEQALNGNDPAGTATGIFEGTGGDSKALLKPLVLLLSGSMLLFFCFLLLLCGTDGRLTLTWNTNYWGAYLLAAAPLLFFGWRALSSPSSRSL